MPLSAIWKWAAGRIRFPSAVGRRKPVRGIHARELIRGERRNRTGGIRGPLERVVVMDDDNPVPREPHVELESVRSKRQAVVERRDGVLGPKRRAAPVRIDKRTQGEHLKLIGELVNS